MKNQKLGILNAFGAFLTWGLCLPSALKALGGYEQPLSAMSVRIFWSFGVIFIIQLVRGQLGIITQLLKPRIFLPQFCAAFLVSINWFVFIYAIQIRQLNQAALGYYILPLIGVLVGMLVYKEKLNNKQKFAILLATMGIGYTIFATGTIPIISLSVALSFTFYSMIKKNTRFDAFSGLYLETFLMCLFLPLFYFIFGIFDQVKIVPSAIAGYPAAFFVGLFTIAPLFFFAQAIKLMDFSLYSVLSWFVPTIQFITSVFFWHEPFDASKLVTFIFIWTALAIYGYSLFEGKKADSA
ncbi:MAG: EamA family transporter [Alphaproteobacteria bacterium]